MDCKCCGNWFGSAADSEICSTCERAIQRVGKYLSTIDPIHAAGGWISVKERLPEPGERVLASNGYFVCESYLDQYGYWRRGGRDLFFMTPTHWQPLPEPPGEEENNARV